MTEDSRGFDTLNTPVYHSGGTESSLRNAGASSSAQAAASGQNDVTFKQPSSVARSLNFETETMSAANVRQTRSQTDLRDIPIESLLSNYIPPDVTPDMYDFQPMDDYSKFLADTFFDPNTAVQLASSQDGEAVAGGSGTGGSSGAGAFAMEEDTTDPDYMFQVRMPRQNVLITILWKKKSLSFTKS